MLAKDWLFIWAQYRLTLWNMESDTKVDHKSHKLKFNNGRPQAAFNIHISHTGQSVQHLTRIIINPVILPHTHTHFITWFSFQFTTFRFPLLKTTIICGEAATPQCVWFLIRIIEWVRFWTSFKTKHHFQFTDDYKHPKKKQLNIHNNEINPIWNRISLSKHQLNIDWVTSFHYGVGFHTIFAHGLSQPTTATTMEKAKKKETRRFYNETKPWTRRQ